MSRNGYQYQDLCALRYSIRAASGAAWDEVWCESHDDIVLYASREGAEHYRFVQVKYRSEPAQHWTPARLTEYAPNKTVAESMVCKLFARDIFSGTCDFRLATNIDASANLAPLTYRWNRSERTGDAACEGVRSLIGKLAGWTPCNGKDVADHVLRFAIERHSADPGDMEVVIARELTDLLGRHGRKLLPEELENVFRFLYGEVFRAAATDLDQGGHPERITAEAFQQVVLTEGDRVCANTEVAADTPPAETLRHQLGAVGADEGAIKNAVELRQRYYGTWRAALGTDMGSLLENVLADVQAICARESLRAGARARRDGGTLLAAVLDGAERLHERRALEQRGIALHLVHGMCYFTIGRGGLVLAETVDVVG